MGERKKDMEESKSNHPVLSYLSYLFRPAMGLFEMCSGLGLEAACLSLGNSTFMSGTVGFISFEINRRFGGLTHTHTHRI